MFQAASSEDMLEYEIFRSMPEAGQWIQT